MYPNTVGGILPQVASTSSQSSHLQHHQMQHQQAFSLPPQHHHHHQQQQQQQQQQQYMHLPNHLDPGLMASNGQFPLSQQTSLINNGGGLVPKQEMITPVPEVDKEKEKQARENHCEIERRRRVKMAAYFNELCVMVPTCNTLQRKPDKLTILRMASSHMRNLRGNNALLANSNVASTNDNNSAYKPSFLTDQELKHLILEAADGFLFVSQCDTGNIIYVSDAIKPVLSYMPNEWSNRSLFDFVHPDDLDKVRDQLSTLENSSNNTTGRILDLKTGTVKKEGHPNTMRSHIGSRRSFICRIKLGMHQQHLQQQQQQHRQIMDPNVVGFWSNSNARLNRNRNTLHSNLELEQQQQHKQNYSVIHITGYTKVWPPNQSASNQNQNSSNIYQNNENTNFHLIAIARIQMTSAPTDLINSTNAEFVTRHDQNGLISFVDQRVTALLGYQPNEMLKKSFFDFCIAQDQGSIKEQFKQIYETKQTQPVQINLHMIASTNMQNEIIQFKTSAYAFCNPCNDAFEFIVCTHSCLKFNDINNSNNGFGLTVPCNTNNGNVVLNDAGTNDSIQYNQYQNMHQHYSNSQMQSINNYSTQQYQQYQQQSNLANNVGNTNGSYNNYLMMQNMNSNSIENYNSLGVNQTSSSVNSGIPSSTSSSSSSTPVSSTTTGNINQNLSPSNLIAASSTTPNTTVSSNSSSAASGSTSNLTILQQRSSNLPLSNTANNWSNTNTASSTTGYSSVDEY